MQNPKKILCHFLGHIFPKLFKMMTSHLKTLRNRLILLILMYSLIRLLFFFFNFHLYGPFPINDLLFSFLHGLRFDLAAIFLLNVPLILLSLILPEKGRWPYFLTHGLFLVLNLPFIFINLIDLEYFKYTGKRMGLDIFIIKNETMNQFDQFLNNYWFLVLLSICFMLALHILGRQKRPEIPRPDHCLLRVLPQRSLVGLAIIILTIFFIRGGTQGKVLKPIHAYTSAHFNLGHLVLNSTFTLLWGQKNRGFKKKATYFKTKDEVLQYLPRPSRKRREIQTDNVVLIILESFSTEFWGAANNYPGYTPFLDSLAQKGLFFKRNFTNSRNSLNAIFSILFGVPTLIDGYLAKSNYQHNTWIGLGHVLAQAGYHTSFFQGAPKDSLYLDGVSRRAGLTNHYHMGIYPQKEAHYNGHWGIHDRPFLQFMAKKLSLHPRPFFSTVFTLSSHQPFEIPPEEKGRFRKGPSQMYEAIGYTDDSLRSFFETAKSMPWFKDTLFIITGDHTQAERTRTPNTGTPVERFMVPLLLYHPGKALPSARVNQVTQHADIFPTIMDYLGLTQNKSLLFGQSVFDNTREDLALFYLEGHYWLIQNDYFLQYNSYQKKALLFDYSDHAQKNPLNHPQIKSNMLKKLQAHIQYFQNGLIENSLYQ